MSCHKFKCPFAILAVIMFLASCQATPEKEVVVNKGGDWVQTMIEKSKGTIDDPSNVVDELVLLEYNVPQMQTYSLNGDNISVELDAQVYIPEYSLPMAILEERDIEYSQIKRFFELLGLEKTHLYDFEFVRIATTKQHVQTLIDRQLKEISLMMKNEGVDTSYVEEQLELLYQEKESAPKDFIEAANQLGLSDNSISKPIEITENNFDKQAYTLIVGETDPFCPMIRLYAIKGKDQRLIYERTSKVGEPSGRHPSNVEEIGFSLDDALSIAEPYVNVFGKGLELVETGTMGSFESVFDPRPHGYVFIYKRIIYGVKNEYVLPPSDGWRGAAVVSTADINMEDALMYSAPPAEEKLVISVTNEGLYALDYSSPRVVKELLSYPIEILPFEQIMKRFDQYIVMHGYDDDKKIAIKIDRIQLGMMDVKIADQNHEYLSIPVWDFYGACQITSPGITDELAIHGSDPFHSWLTINAIDGSIINRASGY